MKKNKNLLIFTLLFFTTCFLNKFSLLKVNATNMKAYFREAEEVTMVGSIADETYNGTWGKIETAKFDNTEFSSSKYGLYSNCVIASNGEKYDLVIYPKKVNSTPPRLVKDTEIYGKIPALRTPGGSGYSCYKLVITKHGNINSPVSMDVFLGTADLDHYEYIVLPLDMKNVVKGSKLTTLNNWKHGGVVQGNRYIGQSDANGDASYTTNLVYGEITIPTTGITIFYGATDGKGFCSSLSFNEILERNPELFPTNTTYTIQFNTNGGSGSVPSTITRTGTDTSTVMGDISSTAPTKTGYKFMGWSASSSWSSKRIAYTSSNGGSTASDGTAAKVTSSSWTYADYCSYTGGSSSSTTLNLYAQWERQYSHTLNYDANGGENAPSGSTVSNSSSSYNMTVSSSVPTKTNYRFTGWNTKADGTGTAYAAGTSVAVGADATVTLYAQWELDVAKYTVNHYAQNEDGTYTLVKTEEFEDTIGKTVTPDTRPQTGRNAPAKQSVVIKADGSTVVNYYYDVTRSDINGTVSWNDNRNKYGTRPDSVTVTLYKNGKYCDKVEGLTANTTNTYSFPNMQKYDLTTGEEIVWTVTQSKAKSKASEYFSEDKYETTQKGFDFLNKLVNIVTPTSPDDPDDPGFHVKGNIYWEDNEDLLGFRPDTVTITLYQKGEDGEWKPYGEPVIVDAKTENQYIFAWLPKYWYDADDVPNKYEYKVEETLISYYVVDGELVEAYTIIPDKPNDNDFTNRFIFPVKPFTSLDEHNNTLTVRTDTEEKIAVTLRPLEQFIDTDYNVSYGEPTGMDVKTLTDNEGTVITGIPSARYEIIIEDPDYTIEDMELTLSENMELEKIGDKWYITIKQAPEDAIGTLDISLTKKTQYYQDRQRINNYFKAACAGLKEVAAISMLSDFITKPSEAITVEYMDSETIDNKIYEIGDIAVVLDYDGEIPENMEFTGWSETEDSEEAELQAGGTIIIGNENVILYPVFREIAEASESSEILEEDSAEQEISEQEEQTEIIIGQ